MFYVLFYGFWTCLVLFGLWSAVLGGSSERWAAGMMCTAALLTAIVGDASNTHWHRPQLGMLAVDCLLLAGLIVLALRSSRFWPMTLASLQLIAVATHPALWIDPRILPFSYALIQGFWAYPMMFLVGVGAWRYHRRRRVEPDGGPGSGDHDPAADQAARR